MLSDWDVDFSLSTWFKFAGADTGGVALIAGENAFNGGELQYVPGANFSADVGQSDSSYFSVSDAGLPSFDVWHSYGMTWEAASKTLSLYLDGILVDSDIAPLSMDGADAANAIQLFISASAGEVGPSAIWRNRVLTADMFALIATGLPFDMWT